MREYQNSVWVPVLSDTVKNDDDFTAYTIDLIDAHFAEIVIFIPAAEATVEELWLIEGDDIGGTDWSEIDGTKFGTVTDPEDQDVDGDNAYLPSAATDGEGGVHVFQIDCSKRKRYVAVNIKAGSATADTQVSAIARLTPKIGVSDGASAGALHVVRV